MSLWKDLERNDLIGKLKPLFMEGRLYIDKDDFKIRRMKQVVHVNNPWLYIKQPDWINCALWHQIYFDQLKMIHSACFNCFKVVVVPETVKELFDLYEVMLKLDLPSKCGVEIRMYVDRIYGAYFYCNGLDHGKEVFNHVKPIIEKEIRSDISIILKRGCTEFEMIHGDSSEYEQKEVDRQTEKLLEENSDIPIEIIGQPELVKIHTKRMWLAWAYKNKDMTCMDFNNGEPLAEERKKPTTYHDGVNKDV